MDPLTAGLGAVSLGTSLIGMFGAASTAQQTASVSRDISGLEGQENNVRQQAMQESAGRSQLQTLRTAQRARSMAVQAGATQTGSLTGSGVQGGEAETTSEGYFGLQGINNQVGFGTSLFGLDSKISADKMQLASLGGTSATYQGITSLGGSMLKATPLVSNIFGGKPQGIGTFSNGGNDGAAPTWGG